MSSQASALLCAHSHKWFNRWFSATVWIHMRFRSVLLLQNWFVFQKKYFEKNIQNLFSVNANQKWNQRCRFEPPVWTDLVTTLIGSPRNGLLRHFTTLFVLVRQKPCFAETWGCLLSLTALCRQKTDVTPQARLYPLEIGVCASEEQMGKPKKKSECVTKCFKTSVIAF